MHHLSMMGLQAFRRVVEQQSFKNAGDSLGISGSAVSKLVAQLEENMGVRLLHRTTRSVTVTEAGNTFYKTTVNVLEEIDLAVETICANIDKPKGVLKVSVPTSFALMWLSERIPAFMARFSEVKLDLSLNDRYADLVEEGFDCAIRIATQMPDSGLFARRLGIVERVLVAAPSYLKRAPTVLSPADLTHHKCLIYTLSSTPNLWPFGSDSSPINVEVSGTFEVNNSVMLREVLVAGCGITLTPRFVVEDLLSSGQLVEVIPSFRSPPHVIYGVIAHKKYLPQKVRSFLDFVASEFAIGTPDSLNQCMPC